MFNYQIYSINENDVDLSSIRFLVEVSDVLEVEYENDGLTVPLDKTRGTDLLEPNTLYEIEGYPENYIYTNDCGKKEVYIKRIR